MRASILVIGGLATALAIVVKSIYDLFYLCSDLSYCIVLPQFITVVHMPSTNRFGAFAGYVVGLFLRISGGEIIFNFPALMKYPWYNDDKGQLFPYKSFAFIMSLLAIIAFSWLARFLLSLRYSGEELERVLGNDFKIDEDSVEDDKHKEEENVTFNNTAFEEKTEQSTSVC